MRSPVKIWRNQKKVVNLVGKTGKIIGWTIIRAPSAGFTEQAPYPVAIVVLEKGRRIMAQLVDWETKHLAFGQKVVTVVRQIKRSPVNDVILYGIKVKPLYD